MDVRQQPAVDSIFGWLNTYVVGLLWHSFLLAGQGLQLFWSVDGLIYRIITPSFTHHLGSQAGVIHSLTHHNSTQVDRKEKKEAQPPLEKDCSY
jgi:hypothetical protein